MAKITIDGISYQVDEGQNLLQACLSLGLDLPYFCWHPALGSVGACRQCALIQYQNEDDQRGRLVMSCMTPVGEGQILSINAENAVNFRAGVIETLMTNHPHDCPVCEEGGECHLQDMTVMSGHHQRRYEGQKRTFNNQNLGPCIGHEMNRCITCYRCLRYYRDYAGGEDLHAMASRNKIYFGRFQDGTLESEFSGNLVEVCPTGVFTDKTLSRDYSRKWDLQCAPSVCVHCSLGCNTSPGERYGRLKRVQNRYNNEVNGHFLCDRGRFGYDFVNHNERPLQPSIVNNDAKKEISSQDAISALQAKLSDDSICWIGIGSPRATLESNLALQRLVGAERFFSGLNRQDEAINQSLLKLMRSGHGETVSMQQAEQADAILILGEDITNTAPRLALSVRQAVRAAGRAKAEAIGIPAWQDQAVQIAGQDAHHPLYLSQSHTSKLDGLAKETFLGTPTEQARLGFAIAHAICPDAPPVSGLTKAQSALAEDIAKDLIKAKNPLLISGASYGCLAIIEATEQILAALSKVRKQSLPWLTLVFKECNSLGLALLNHRGQENCLDDAFQIASHSASNGGKKIAAVILENDLYQRAGTESVDQFFAALVDSVVIDYLPSSTLDKAEMVLPAASFAESQGVIVNNEARGQMLFPVYPGKGEIKMAWQWLHLVAPQTNKALADFADARSALQACLQAEPMLAALESVLVDPDLRYKGMKIARMSPRSSGRTAMLAQVSVHEPKQTVDNESALAFTMEGVPFTAMAAGQPSGGLMPFSWYPGWNSNQSIHKFLQEVGGPVKGAAAGVRLSLHSHPDLNTEWVEPPKKPRGKADHLLLLTTAQIFGSDELSVLSPAIAERSKPAQLSLHPEDANAFNIKADDLVQVSFDHHHIQLSVVIQSEQAKRVALISDTTPELKGHSEAWIKVRSLGTNPVIVSDRRENDV
ncbi:MAG: NADH-quinone oxidoreductase subunit NuoG [Motiliproteus sp.]